MNTSANATLSGVYSRPALSGHPRSRIRLHYRPWAICVLCGSRLHVIAELSTIKSPNQGFTIRYS